MRGPAPRARAVERALFLLVLAGALRIAWIELIHPQTPLAPGPRVAARYAPLLPRIANLPRHQPLAWVSESGLNTVEGQRRFGEASLAFAPRIVLPDDGSAALVLFDLDHPARLGELAAKQGLRVVQSAPDGPALLERIR